MQSQKDYLQKNHVTLTLSGPCQFCGAPVKEGANQCMELFHSVLAKEYQQIDYAKVHERTTDAHALQHPELHGIKNNSFHLLRLGYLQYKNLDALPQSTLAALQLYLKKDEIPSLPPPEVTLRGEYTVYDVAKVTNASTHQKRVLAWSDSVWEAWKQHHPWVKQTLSSLNLM